MIITKKEAIECFESYLIEQELSANTREAYLFSMQCFFERYDEATKTNALLWKKDLQDAGLKPKSVNIRLNGYNKFVTMEGRDREKIKTLRVHSATAISNVISDSDYMKLCQGLKKDGNLRWYYTIRLMASTGVRVSELIRLKKSDFDRGYAEMWTKGKIRRIYIPDSFRQEAKEYYKTLDSDDYLVRSRNGGEITTRGIAAMLQNLAKRYSIDKEVMHPHSFRHLFAVEFLKRNNNLSLLADIMGHSSVATTAIYTRLTREQQIDAVNRTINW